MFQIGQRVVCVKEIVSGPFERALFTFPHVGRIYTVRDIGCDLGVPWLRLIEVRNHEVFCYDVGAVTEPCFSTRAFRPIIERKTDISVFEQILRRQDEKVKA